jgi:Rrf2 family protein
VSFISAGVEYGLHCLLFLNTSSDGGPEACVRDLAELQGVPIEYLAKLFTKLSNAGLVVATEGARGGFALSRPADEISFLDVVEAIDGDKSIFECREIRTRCAVFDGEVPAWATKEVCSIHAVMLAAEKCMRDELASHTLADITAQVLAKAPTTFGPQVVAWLENRSSNRRADRDTGVKGKNL